MSLDSFQSFRELVFQDPDLQARLRDIVDRAEFIALVKQLGGERGYTFTGEDVNRAMQASRRTWIERTLG